MRCQEFLLAASAKHWYIDFPLILASMCMPLS
jgi:hypothetical protein